MFGFAFIHGEARKTFMTMDDNLALVRAVKDNPAAPGDGAAASGLDQYAAGCYLADKWGTLCDVCTHPRGWERAVH